MTVLTFPFFCPSLIDGISSTLKAAKIMASLKLYVSPYNKKQNMPKNMPINNIKSKLIRKKIVSKIQKSAKYSNP